MIFKIFKIINFCTLIIYNEKRKHKVCVAEQKKVMLRNKGFEAQNC